MASEQRPGRSWWHRVIPWLAIAVVSAVGAGAVAAWVDQDETSVAEEASPAVVVDPALRIPSTGTVVGLDIVDPAVLTAGWPAVLHVDVADTEGIDRIELWEDDRVVDCREVGGRGEVHQRVEWVPTTPGFHLLSARSVATDGRVTMSPAIWVAVNEPPKVLDGATVLGTPAAGEAKRAPSSSGQRTDCP